MVVLRWRTKVPNRSLECGGNVALLVMWTNVARRAKTVPSCRLNAAHRLSREGGDDVSVGCLNVPRLSRFFSFWIKEKKPSLKQQTTMTGGQVATTNPVRYEIANGDFCGFLKGFWKRNLEWRHFGGSFKHLRSTNNVVFIEEDLDAAHQPNTQ